MLAVISSRRPAPVLVAGLAGVLALAGCGSGDDSTSSSAGSSPAAGFSAAVDGPDGGDVCGQLESEGATGASWGPVQAWLPRTDLLADIDGKLTPMASVPGPADVSDAWTTQQGYLQTLRLAAERLPDGGRLSDPELIALRDDVTAAQQTLTDWWFDTCR